MSRYLKRERARPRFFPISLPSDVFAYARFGHPPRHMCELLSWYRNGSVSPAEPLPPRSKPAQRHPTASLGGAFSQKYYSVCLRICPPWVAGRARCFGRAAVSHGAPETWHGRFPPIANFVDQEDDDES